MRVYVIGAAGVDLGFLICGDSSVVGILVEFDRNF